MIRIRYQVLFYGAPALIAANGFPLWAQGSKAEVCGKSNTQDISIVNAHVHVQYHRRAGTMDISWSDGHRLLGIVSSATLADGRKLSTDQYPDHNLQASEADSAVGHGREYIIRSSGNGLQALSKHILLYDDRPWLTLQAELGSEGSRIGTRHFDPLVIFRDDPVRIGPAAVLRVLHVPFDNDMWFRFASIPVSTMKDDEVSSGEQVTAIYDNAGRFVPAELSV
jgi:alpha-galactosidase